jgi:hypothetical protein
VQILEPMGFEPMCIYKYVNSEWSHEDKKN